jgi:dihydrofolate reductase
MKITRKIIVYIATSADGYIARPDGDVEWLNRRPRTVDYGMRELYAFTHADRLLDAYMDLLPGDFKSRFPSMRALYDELSGELHVGIGSAELFAKADAQLLQHFEARRLFEIPDASVART